ncbi:MAG: hypothetical protein RMK29_15590 [Myxococcales bacterium]|nr:hypothetical protein [Myxococcota bacterium]MDW8283138.1 hypothetical protein [Myxococcales bacterium]
MRRGLLLILPLCCSVPARASVFDFLAEVVSSRPMARAPGDLRTEKPRAIYLNGFPMYVSTGRTDRSIKDVLDFYQERYPGGALKQIVGKPVGIRREGESTGTLMVVDVADKATALEVFDGKRTLPEAGPVRLVYARRAGLHTEYLIAWSERPMPRTVLEPVQSGDVPGRDVAGVPRPQGAVRSFSFEEPGAGYRLVMYRVAESPEQALRSAAARLDAEGWQEDRSFADAARQRRKLMARFSRGNRDVVVTARPLGGTRPGAQLAYLLRDL